MLLDFFGGIVLTAVMVVNVNAVVSTLSVSQFAKLALAAIIGLWIGLQVSLATAGAFAGELSRTFPLIGMMLAIPLVATAIAAAVSPKVRSALLELPQPLLIGLNASRVLGVFFLLLAANGRLGGPFPQSAGWGDIITGVVALPLAFIAVRRPAPDADLLVERIRPRRPCRGGDARHPVGQWFCFPGDRGRRRIRRHREPALVADPDRAGAPLHHHARHHLRAASPQGIDASRKRRLTQPSTGCDEQCRSLYKAAAFVRARFVPYGADRLRPLPMAAVFPNLSLTITVHEEDGEDWTDSAWPSFHQHLP